MNKSATRYFSNKQEKHIAKELGGKQTPNSGATPTNGVENHQILKGELEKYLSEGYWRGITRRNK